MNDQKYHENWNDARECITTTEDEKAAIMYTENLREEALEMIFTGRADLDAMIFGFKTIVTRLEIEKAQIDLDMRNWTYPLPE